MDLPPEAGVPFGAGTDTKYVVLQMHYSNIEGVPDQVSAVAHVSGSGDTRVGYGRTCLVCIWDSRFVPQDDVAICQRSHCPHRTGRKEGPGAPVLSGRGQVRCGRTLCRGSGSAACVVASVGKQGAVCVARRCTPGSPALMRKPKHESGVSVRA